MCPACVASAAWVAGSVMSTGGIAAFAVKMVRGKKGRSQDNSRNTTERRNHDVNNDDEQDGTSNGSVIR
jgi:hypothetical protein